MVIGFVLLIKEQINLDIHTMTEAHHIKNRINRYLDNLYGADEIEQLQEIIRLELDSGYLDERMKEIWLECLSSTKNKEMDKEQLKKEARRLIERIEQSPFTKRRKVYAKWIGIAASLLLLITLSIGVYLMNGRKGTAGDISYLEIQVPYGKKKELLLADGSRIILNAGSLFRYPDHFAGEEREVYLDGEAFFSVESNPKQPFIVVTRNMTIEVLGTEFNVKTYGEDELASVSVKKGKVQVNTEEMSSRLSIGDHITLNNVTKDFRKKKVEANSITHWITGGLAFHETPIADVAKELTRIYNCKIYFEDGQIFTNLIKGEHDNKSIESVLKSIEYTSGIKFRKEQGNYILYKE